MGRLVQEYAQRFEEMHGLGLRFSDAATERLVALASEQSRHVRDLCTEKFKDFQFGLKLIAQNTGQKEFTIDIDAVETPDKVLSEWVVASYRLGEGKAES
jgi:ATP-dependent Clp protease ATP-binding subunit ClpX